MQQVATSRFGREFRSISCRNPTFHIPHSAFRIPHSALFYIFHRVRFLRREHLSKRKPAQPAKPAGDLAAEKISDRAHRREHHNRRQGAGHELLNGQTNDQDGQQNGLANRQRREQVDLFFKPLESFFVWVVFHH